MLLPGGGNLLGNSPKEGIDENKVSLGAVSNEPRCTCCFSSQVRNLCLSTDNIRRNLVPRPGNVDCVRADCRIGVCGRSERWNCW